MKQYSTYSLKNIAATLCALSGVTPPVNACREPIQPVLELAEESGIAQVDRILFFSPDAIGRWLLKKYHDRFRPALEVAPLEQPLDSVYPSVTPVCYATMFSGAMPQVHGIDHYVRPPVTIDTVFDAFARADKQCAMVAVRDSSDEIIFRQRQLDVYCTESDAQAVEVTRRLIQEDRYDMIVCYQGDYDHTMHLTVPESDEALEIMECNIRQFRELADCAKACWSGHDILFTVSPDHGMHIDYQSGHGTHGSDMPYDMELTHLFGFQKRQDLAL